jgi:hypothetical protein
MPTRGYHSRFSRIGGALAMLRDHGMGDSVPAVWAAIRKVWSEINEGASSARYSPHLVGGGGAFALPPSARSIGLCSFPASRFPLRGRPEHSDAWHQSDRTISPSSVTSRRVGYLRLRGVPPSLGDERPQPAFDPKLMKELADVRLPVVIPPAADDRVDDPDDFTQRHGRISSYQVPYLNPRDALAVRHTIRTRPPLRLAFSECDWGKVLRC